MRGHYLNRTLVITLLALCPINFIIGLFGYFFSYFGLITEGIIMLIAFILNLSVVMPVAGTVLKKKDGNLWNLLWFLIPSGIIILFAFLGYVTLEALDRAYPSF